MNRWERRQQRKANRNAPRPLLNGISGEHLAPEIMCRITHCADLHRRKQTKCEAAFSRIADKLTELTDIPCKAQVGIAFSAELFIVVDFFFHFARLAVEIDGPEHQQEKDEWRDAMLKRKGVKVIRFANNFVLDHPRAVFIRLVEALFACRRTCKILNKRLSPNWRREVVFPDPRRQEVQGQMDSTAGGTANYDR